MGNKDKRNKIRYSKKRRLFRENQHKSSNVAAEENLSNLEELQFKGSSAKKMKILSSCFSSKSSVDIVNNDFVNKNNFSANDDQSNSTTVSQKMIKLNQPNIDNTIYISRKLYFSSFRKYIAYCSMPLL